MSISVIIPTLNEEACIAQAIRSVRGQEPLEVLVVDGGSTDATRAAAREADRFLLAPRGRARQMNLAAQHARGDLLLFLHADCTLETGALKQAEALLRRPGVVAGCFQQTVAAPHWLFSWINFWATMRVHWTGMVYGDQGLFVGRDAFAACGGFPELRLMEDLFLSRRLGRLGRIVVSRKRIWVSPRRWRHAGIIRQTLRNWGLTILAAAGVSPDQLAQFYPVVR